MHSPRRSVRPSDCAVTPRLSPSSERSLNSDRIQEGKSPPTMSPSRVKRAQREISAASSAVRGLAEVSRPNTSCMLRRQT